MTGIIVTMMTLGQYLEDKKILQEDFAKDIVSTQATVSRLARGVATPSLKLAQKIEVATGGAVPVSAWIPRSQEAAE